MSAALRPTASSIVSWQIFKLRFIDGDARSTTSQTMVSVTDNSNPGAVGILHSPRLPCDMDKSTTCTIRNAQSTPLTFKSRAERIMTRVVTIRYPHDTIRIAILGSRYDTYRDTCIPTCRKWQMD